MNAPLLLNFDLAVGGWVGGNQVENHIKIATFQEGLKFSSWTRVWQKHNKIQVYSAVYIVDIYIETHTNVCENVHACIHACMRAFMPAFVYSCIYKVVAPCSGYPMT